MHENAKYKHPGQGTENMSNNKKIQTKSASISRRKNNNTDKYLHTS